MTDKYFTSKTAMATAANVTRNTLARWMQKSDFPKQTTNGWERVKVLEFAKVALAKAAKSQTGTDADLKREKLRLQVKILETELAKKRNELCTEQSGTVPRDIVLREFAELTLTVWAAMDGLVVTLGNTECRGNPKAYGAICGLATDFLRRIKSNLKRRLADSPVKMTTEEIEDAVTYSGGNQW